MSSRRRWRASAPAPCPPGKGDVARGIADVPVAPERLARDVLLKLESLQVSGSFKARGAMNKVLSLAPERGASWSRHGIGRQSRPRGRVCRPRRRRPDHGVPPDRTSPAKAARIEGWGARVVREGDVWDDAHAAAVAHADARRPHLRASVRRRRGRLRPGDHRARDPRAGARGRSVRRRHRRRRARRRASPRRRSSCAPISASSASSPRAHRPSPRACARTRSSSSPRSAPPPGRSRHVAPTR